MRAEIFRLMHGTRPGVSAGYRLCRKCMQAGERRRATHMLVQPWWKFWRFSEGMCDEHTHEQSDKGAN